MIAPHASAQLNPLFVADQATRQSLILEAHSLPCVMINSAAAANAVMLGGGYFNPLTGYMNVADTLSVVRDWHTCTGLFWPVPILNQCRDVTAIGTAQRIALRDPNVEGNPVLAIQDVEAIETLSEAQMEEVVQQVFGTTDESHPGVATFNADGAQIVSGPIEVLNYSYFQTEFPDTFRTATQLRQEISDRGWNKVVAFQTRNPMHRAHEELCKMALQAADADGLLVHMLLGRLKPGDIPAEVRDDAIRKMVDLYFPENTVMVYGYGFDMLYAGPREAVLHALFRQNAGCSHLIVGRDHAGVGDFYGPFDAQVVFDEQVSADDLQIEIYRADHTAYSKKLRQVVMMRDAPDHKPEDFVLLSGTRVREMLAAGQTLPAEFARPEVAKILMDHYQKDV